MRKWIIAIAICICVPAVAWYGWLYYISRDARRIDGANVFVTFYIAPSQCDVRAGLYAARHALRCGDVPSYIRDDLKLPVGATFAVSDLGSTHNTDIATLKSALKAAGYVSVGGWRVAFITEPERPAKSQ